MFRYCAELLNILFVFFKTSLVKLIDSVQADSSLIPTATYMSS